MGYDYHTYFRPAVLNGAPYSIEGFYSPPWLLALYAPFTLLPAGFDIVALIFAALTGWVYALRRLHATSQVIVLLLLTPNLQLSVLLGNHDFLIPLGLVLPPWLGLFLVLAKPQIGFGIALFWAAEAWRRGGFHELVRLLAPIVVVSILAMIPYGFWPLAMLGAPQTAWNISPFPLLVPVGLILLYRGIRYRRVEFSILAAPFLAPYVGVNSLPVVLVGLLPSRVEMLIAIAGLWVHWFSIR
jgi:hypothetical protein